MSDLTIFKARGFGLAEPPWVFSEPFESRGELSKVQVSRGIQQDTL